MALPEVVCGEETQGFQGNQGGGGLGFLVGDDDGDYLPGEEAVSAFGGVPNLAGGCLGRLPLASKGVVHPPWAMVVRWGGGGGGGPAPWWGGGRQGSSHAPSASSPPAATATNITLPVIILSGSLSKDTGNVFTRMFYSINQPFIILP